MGATSGREVFSDLAGEFRGVVSMDGEWKSKVGKNGIEQDVGNGEGGVVLCWHGDHIFGIYVDKGDYEAVPVVGW